MSEKQERKAKQCTISYHFITKGYFFIESGRFDQILEGKILCSACIFHHYFKGCNWDKIFSFALRFVVIKCKLGDQCQRTWIPIKRTINRKWQDHFFHRYLETCWQNTCLAGDVKDVIGPHLHPSSYRSWKLCSKRHIILMSF